VNSRITTDPEILGGKPCLRGTRISVEFILELLASGAARDEIVRAYPQLTSQDVEAAVRFGSGAGPGPDPGNWRRVRPGPKTSPVLT
jgi:uncharacterized protein (DUF433 family)